MFSITVLRVASHFEPNKPATYVTDTDAHAPLPHTHSCKGFTICYNGIILNGAVLNLDFSPLSKGVAAQTFTDAVETL